jgi:hypothetical protein
VAWNLFRADTTGPPLRGYGKFDAPALERGKRAAGPESGRKRAAPSPRRGFVAVSVQLRGGVISPLSRAV